MMLVQSDIQSVVKTISSSPVCTFSMKNIQIVMFLDTYKYLVIYRFWTLSGWLLIPATLMVTCRPPEVSKISCHLRPRRPVNFPFWENRKAEQEEPNPDHTANELDQNVKNLPSILLQAGGAHGTGKTLFVCFLKLVGLLQSDAAVEL